MQQASLHIIVDLSKQVFQQDAEARLFDILKNAGIVNEFGQAVESSQLPNRKVASYFNQTILVDKMGTEIGSCIIQIAKPGKVI